MSTPKYAFQQHAYFTHVARIFICLVCISASGLFSKALAQEPKTESRSLTLEEFNKVKTFIPKNLDQDTYVKFENAYILDRYQMKPPYVFKYSDGIERKIYLYKLMDNKTKKELGMVAFYHTPGNSKTISLCIPTPNAPKEVWARYIDDLKEYGAQENGLLSAFSYVMSREMSAMFASGGGQAAPVAGAATDYDVCFPEEALVRMADGSEKAIKDVRAGDEVAAFDAATGALQTTRVKEVHTHADKAYTITSVLLISDEPTASMQAYVPSVMLEATPNHPVYTNKGRKTIETLEKGEYLYQYNSASGMFIKYKVMQVVTEARQVKKVYNLVTDKQNFLINNTVVLDK
ncbi:hypothetical protein GXP67_18955 [Rhodocytophaga rosea]|uniref:Hint domain-containing protein n=1 Tax=Rhodocytophaga rosea TaxID=2704465 RepID=A0A6C0GKP5_9BACT|nr:Hint domain-containing protein [Rhodocytophaga rosea]QHT68575.1 hypothetical protein GXP67_18955 [Rhodocytophaga rosea]